MAAKVLTFHRQGCDTPWIEKRGPDPKWQGSESWPSSCTPSGDPRVPDPASLPRREREKHRIEALKRRVHGVLEAVDEDPFSRAVNVGLALLVSLNALAVILETVPSIDDRWHGAFRWFEEVSVAIFLVEYLLRLWSCTVQPEYAGDVAGRLRFAARPMSIVDAVAIVPALFETGLFLDLRYVRVMRLVRLLRVFKFARYTETVRTFARVVSEKRMDLVLIGLFLGLLLVIASATMYFAEYDEQPDVFSSIPAAMWWAMQTLTTVGYGDIVPKTPLGKLLGTLIALVGIGFFALPAGILAAGFAEEIERSGGREAPSTCPNCGHDLRERDAGGD